MKQLFIALGIAFILPLSVSAASMSIAPSATSVTVGDIITARVVVNSQGVAINNAEAVLTFPTNILNVVSVTKSPSIFTLWVVEPTYSNNAGTISYNGGIPSPGYSGSNGTVMTVTFVAKTSGTATLSLSDAAVRANDGKGTNVLSTTGGAQLTITAPVVPVAAPTPAPAPSTPAPTLTPKPAPSATSAAIDLSSPTHPDETLWYGDDSPVLTWSLPDRADAVQVIADRKSTTAPSVTYTPVISEKTVMDLDDGTWYFNLRYRTAGTWSAVASYRLNIDTTAPALENAEFIYNEAEHALLVNVKAEDEGSGVAFYEAYVDTEEVTHITSEEMAEGEYEIPVDGSGTHTITLRAYDAAGNSTEVTEEFSVSTSVMDTEVFDLGGISIRLLPLLLGMALISLLSLIAAIIAIIFAYTHRTASSGKNRTETRHKIHKAFMLLRTDLDKQVRALRKVRTGKELSEREELLTTSISENISDLERYLYNETDILK